MANALESRSPVPRMDLDSPLWDQTTFMGRLKHFFWVTDPRSCLTSEAKLDAAKQLLDDYRIGREPPGTTLQQIIYARKLYESAFHPDTGEKMNVMGRMSFQVPGGMVITGAMLQFYRTTPAVVFWQWTNQSFNALVNYTNRNAQSPTTTTQLGVAYVSATSAALGVSIGLRKFLETRASVFVQRYVPFAAVAAANCVNIPLMRQNEILHGIDVFDENGNKITQSNFAAIKGITQVVLSRITMAAPGMTLLPIAMEQLEKYEWMKKIQFLHAPLQVIAVGCFLTIMVPISCALFPQQCSMKLSTMSYFEPDKYKKLKEEYGDRLPERVYFNKGL